jgi:2-polyprenyl-6-methoxyphenol hydroxylase-like FAD-dependent oxidoreductase
MIDVLIIGGGSAGLFLANTLWKSGISFLVIEKRIHPSTKTKAIGIHPPALTLLNQLGLMDEFLSHGVKIIEGMVFIEKKYYGKMALGSDQFADHVLSIPQFKTEQILEAALPSNYILRGHQFRSFQNIGDAVRVETTRDDGKKVEFKARFVIGADGMNSVVRTAAGIGWNGHTYPYSYTMGDFPDTTNYGNRAVIHLSNDGLTESFPLPDTTRRWVINHNRHPLSVDQLCDAVNQRTGYQLNPAENRMLSNFEIHRYLAESIYKDRVILLGDAAHVMSPIGGQSMNVAWIHADKLGRLFAEYTLGGKVIDHETHKLRTPITEHKSGKIIDDRNTTESFMRQKSGENSSTRKIKTRFKGSSGNSSKTKKIAKSAKDLSKFRFKELNSAKFDKHLQDYEKFVKHSATVFSSRAEFNTKMGLPGKNMFILKGIVKLLLSWPLSKVISKRFTMKSG